MAGVIALSAWTDLPAVARRHYAGFLIKLVLSEKYDSVAAAARIRALALVVHSTADRIIPADQGREVAAALAGSRWLAVEGAGHNDLLSEAVVWCEIEAFLGSLSTRPRSPGPG